MPLPPGPPARRLWALIRPHARSLALASALVVVGSGVGLVAPRVAGMVVDAAVVDASIESLDAVVIALVALFAVRGAVSFGEVYLLRRAGADLLRSLRRRMHAHLVTLGPPFYQERPVGELLSRIGADLQRIQSTITTRVPEGARAALTFVGTLAILLALHVRLTLLALAMVPPITGLAVLYGRRLQRLATRIQDRLADTSATAEEALSGLRTVQALRGEDAERSRYGGRLDELFSLQLANARLVGTFTGLFQFVGYSAFAFVLWYGARLITVGDDLTPGDLTSFLIYTFGIASSVGSLGALYAGVRELRGASARVFEILDTPPSIADAADAAPIAPAGGEVRADEVWFRYPGADRWALRGLSIAAEPGQTVALVGPSGAGKTTLFHLLLRFYDPEHGALAIDGRDLRGATLASVRRSIAVVPQEIFLFAGSIADNIRYARPDATDDEVARAAEAAGADGFIRALAGGYGEIVGERGVKLSAGQRQRVAIARALLRRPAILLLDEATSSLDPDSEAAVQEALGQLMRGRTTFIIAHRLATARQADRIAVLDGGRVVGSGDHDHLFATSELYRRYWELQAHRWRDEG